MANKLKLPVEEELLNYLRASFSLLYIVSPEEQRVEERLSQIAKERQRRCLVWTLTNGFVDMETSQPAYKKADVEPEAQTVMRALDFVLDNADKQPNSLFVLKDFHPFLSRERSLFIRKVRDAANFLSTTSSSMIILSPTLALPPELEKVCTVLDFPLPELEEIHEMLEQTIVEFKKHGAEVELDEKAKEDICKAMQGLTLGEIENALALATVKGEKLSAEDLTDLIRQKEQVIRKSGFLEYFSAEEKMDNVGGLDNLKQWLKKKSFSLTEEAARYGLEGPKGVLLVGVPGCGKSLSVKSISAEWKVPCLKFDVGKVFGKYVGESESNIRAALRAAEAVAPCVLWMDEIEKGFSGVSADLDSGASSRVFGTFLTWMQDKKKSVFVAATANDIQKLPPEFLRKGRFDELFFVDLPTQEERVEIFSIHLKKVNGRREKANKTSEKKVPLLDIASFDVTRCAELTEGYSGADIESIVKSSLEDALTQGRDVTTEDIIAQIEQTLPLSATMKEKIDALRGWGEIHARPASGKGNRAEVKTVEQMERRRKIQF